ncbi:MAG: glycosyltransferase family 4 protein [Planctomycetes bacterium]|nr:glycosyltransferase family 4 protein [Planctomycetota bacterium]
MKIVIIVGRFPPRWLGGMEIATYAVAKQLAQRGHDVHVITTLDKGLQKESLESGFHLHRISYPRIRILNLLVLYAKAILLIKRIDPDLVHAQGTLTGSMPLVGRKILRKPYVVWSHGYVDLFIPVKRTISRWALKNANAVIALTDHMKSEIQKICDRDVLVIPNGIDAERFENFSREESRTALQITNQQKVIMFVGTLSWIKGTQYLIEAMNLVRQQEKDVMLIIIGDGNERQSLEQLVKALGLEGFVTFMGRVPNQVIPEYMAAADVFSLPSLSEAFPLVILEAMASGLPVVATNVRGLSEIIKEEENGFLVESKNANQLAEKILVLLRNVQLRMRISENNKAKAKEYNEESVVQKLEKVYEAIAK